MSASIFMPHGHCYLWEPAMVWLQVATNGAIAAAYLAISATLVYLVYRIKFLPFQRIYLAFGLFILSCAVTHMMDIVVIWRPNYWLDVSIRGISALASVTTAAALLVLVPTVLGVAASLHQTVERDRRLADANRDADTLRASVASLTMTQEQLRQSETSLRTVTESIPTIIWTAKPDGFTDYFNKPWEDYSGQSVVTAAAGGWLEVLHPDDRQRTLDTWNAAVRQGSPYQIEYRFRAAADGTYRWFLGRALPMRDPSGTILRWFGSCTDVHDQREALRAFRESEAASRDSKRFLSIINIQEQVAKASLGSAHAITLIAAQTQELTGAAGVDIARWDGQGFEVVGSSGSLPHGDPQWDQAVVQACERCVREHEPQQVSQVGQARDAASTAVAGTLMVVPLGAEGNVRGVLRAFSPHPEPFEAFHLHSMQLLAGLLVTALSQAQEFADKNAAIVELEAAKQSLTVARQQAEAGARLKSEFLANMSHEIRTPLNGVIGMTDLLLEMELGTQQRQYVEIVQDSGKALLGIINDILDLSKIEANKMQLEIIPFDLRKLLESRAALLASPIKAKGLTLTTLVDPRLAGAWRGDPGRIGQILLNLMGNALKFTEQGIIRLTADLQSAGATHSVVRFTVQDSGIGIAPDDQKRLFEPFTQGDGSTARRFGGTGLGLSISRRLVNLMGGEIGIDSALGRGSTFWFTLTLENGGTKAPEEPTQPTGRTALLNRSQKPRILVADDNAVNQMLAKAMLEGFGCEVEVVKDGQEVLDAWRARLFDLILMDCHMPRLDGYAATQEIRRGEVGSGKHVPIVALTASALQEDAGRCLSCGMDAFMPKPIRRDDLAEMIGRFV